MNKLRIVSFLLAGMLFNGCASIGTIHHGYAQVKYDDGIDKNEAKIIAKNKIITDKDRGSYVVIGPRVYDLDILVAKNKNIKSENFSSRLFNSNGEMIYPNCWAVVFRPKPFPFSFFDMYYLTVIDKRSGEVKYAGADNALVNLVTASLFVIADEQLNQNKGGANDKIVGSAVSK